jgi:hypothetical protein
MSSKKIYVEFAGYGYVSDEDSTTVRTVVWGDGETLLDVDSTSDLADTAEQGSNVRIMNSDRDVDIYGDLLEVTDNGDGSHRLLIAVPPSQMDPLSHPEVTSTTFTLRIEDNYKFSNYRPTDRASGSARYSYGANALARYFLLLSEVSTSISQELKEQGGVSKTSSISCRLINDLSSLDADGLAPTLVLASSDIEFMDNDTRISDTKTTTYGLNEDLFVNNVVQTDFSTADVTSNGATIEAIVATGLATQKVWIGTECLRLRQVDSVTHALAGAVLGTQRGTLPAGQKFLNKYPGAIGQIARLYEQTSIARQLRYTGIVDDINLNQGEALEFTVAGGNLRVFRSSQGQGSSPVPSLQYEGETGTANGAFKEYEVTGQGDYVATTLRKGVGVPYQTLTAFTPFPKTEGTNTWLWAKANDQLFRIQPAGDFIDDNQGRPIERYHLMSVQALRMRVYGQTTTAAIGSLESFPSSRSTPLASLANSVFKQITSQDQEVDGFENMLLVPSVVNVGQDRDNKFEVRGQSNYRINETAPYYPIDNLVGVEDTILFKMATPYNPAVDPADVFNELRVETTALHISSEWAAEQDWEFAHLFEPQVSRYLLNPHVRYTEPSIDDVVAVTPYTMPSGKESATAYLVADQDHWLMPISATAGVLSGDSFLSLYETSPTVFSDDSARRDGRVRINVADAILQVLMSTGSGSNKADFGDDTIYNFDVLPSELGLALPPSLIDTSSFEGILRNANYTVGNLYVDREAGSNIEKWLEANLLKPFFLSLVQDTKGRISLVNLAQALTVNDSDVLGTIDEDDIFFVDGRLDHNITETTKYYAPTMEISNKRFSGGAIEQTGLDVINVTESELFRKPTDNVTPRTLKIEPTHCELWTEEGVGLATITANLAELYVQQFSRIIYRLEFTTTVSKATEFRIGRLMQVTLPSVKDFKNADKDAEYDLSGLIIKNDTNIIAGTSRVTVLCGDFKNLSPRVYPAIVAGTAPGVYNETPVYVQDDELTATFIPKYAAGELSLVRANTTPGTLGVEIAAVYNAASKSWAFFDTKAETYTSLGHRDLPDQLYDIVSADDIAIELRFKDIHGLVPVSCNNEYSSPSALIPAEVRTLGDGLYGTGARAVSGGGFQNNDTVLFRAAYLASNLIADGKVNTSVRSRIWTDVSLPDQRIGEETFELIIAINPLTLDVFSSDGVTPTYYARNSILVFQTIIGANDFYLYDYIVANVDLQDSRTQKVWAYFEKDEFQD